MSEELQTPIGGDAPEPTPPPTLKPPPEAAIFQGVDPNAAVGDHEADALSPDEQTRVAAAQALARQQAAQEEARQAVANREQATTELIEIEAAERVEPNGNETSDQKAAVSIDRFHGIRTPPSEFPPTKFKG